MPDSIEIHPVSKPVCGTIRPPGSKSITNRALVCAALANGTSRLHGALVSEDTEVMIEGLRSLGISVQVEHQGETLTVEGCQGSPPKKEAEIFVANSGTTIRFLTALATLGYGDYRLDGIARMRERPIQDLVDALLQLGAKVSCEGYNGCPPVQIRANGLTGGVAKVRGNISSQYLSGLLMASPCAEDEVKIQITGTLVSVPYVEMTLAVMRSFGVDPLFRNDLLEINVPNGSGYHSCEYSIEPDASAASYFWAAAAVTQGEVTVQGLTKSSLQGDVGFVECLASMGCEVHFGKESVTVAGRPLHGIEVDMNAISDTVQTLSVVALFADSPTIIRNVRHIRYKETDRISAVATELRKLGAEVVERDEGLEIHPTVLRPASIDTYNDHRMAMSFAIAGLQQHGVVIRDPGCTSKTYPEFFGDLSRLCE